MPQPRSLTIRLFLCALASLWMAGGATADVIVLANRTKGRVTCTLRPLTTAVERIVLPPGEVVPIFSDGRVHIGFHDGVREQQYLLDANCAYYFGQRNNGPVELQKIGLGEDPSTGTNTGLPGSARTAPSATIPVRILVDEEEAARPAIWKRRLTARVEAASKILDKFCRIRLQVVDYGTWNTDNNTTEFFESLAEFEKEVSPRPARLAIGFTSQYQVVRGRIHLAGTRGPLQGHILIREWAQHIGEPERLEFLVHELGHHLGASHSPEPNSVMRPVLGDKQAVRANFRIGFDPVNALVIGIIGEEIRRRNVRTMETLSPATRRRLGQIYGELARTMPKDSASPQFVRIIDRAKATPLVSGTKSVLGEIMRSGRENEQLPRPGEANPGQAVRRRGDDLTELYVRRAAARAEKLPKETSTQAFLLALGVSLGEPNLLRQFSKRSAPGYEFETPGQRTVREAFMGKPTIHGRTDLAQHFFVSAYLTATAGTEAANAAGLSKEMLDAGRAKGFSFADMTANKAGVAFAGGVLNKRFTLGMIAENFTIAAFVPPMDDVPDGISTRILSESLGPVTGERFQRELGEIDRRILALPAYQGPTSLSRAE